MQNTPKQSANRFGITGWPRLTYYLYLAFWLSLLIGAFGLLTLIPHATFLACMFCFSMLMGKALFVCTGMVADTLLQLCGLEKLDENKGGWTKALRLTLILICLSMGGLIGYEVGNLVQHQMGDQMLIFANLNSWWVLIPSLIVASITLGIMLYFGQPEQVVSKTYQKEKRSTLQGLIAQVSPPLRGLIFWTYIALILASIFGPMLSSYSWFGTQILVLNSFAISALALIGTVVLVIFAVHHFKHRQKQAEQVKQNGNIKTEYDHVSWWTGALFVGTWVLWMLDLSRIVDLPLDPLALAMLTMVTFMVASYTYKSHETTEACPRSEEDKEHYLSKGIFLKEFKLLNNSSSSALSTVGLIVAGEYFLIENGWLISHAAEHDQSDLVHHWWFLLILLIISLEMGYRMRNIHDHANDDFWKHFGELIAPPIQAIVAGAKMAYSGLGNFYSPVNTEDLDRQRGDDDPLLETDSNASSGTSELEKLGLVHNV